MTYDAAPFHRQESPALSAAPSEPAVSDHLGAETGGPLLIDCDTCCVRGIGCGDCVVTVLLGGPPFGVSLNDEERRALDVLAAAGMVPPLRHVMGLDTTVVEPA